MANICIGNVCFHGDNAKKLHEAIRYGDNSGDYPGPMLIDIADAVGAKVSGDVRYYICTEDKMVDENTLVVEAELANGDKREYFDAIAKALGLTWNGWFSNDDDVWKIINDDRYDDFPDEVLIDVSSENDYLDEGVYEFFRTKKDAEDWLHEQTGFSNTLEEWQELFYDENIGKITVMENVA